VFYNFVTINLEVLIMCNYSKEIMSYINGQSSISHIARSLIQAGATPEELGSLEEDLQTLYDTAKLDDKNVVAINSGLQRETKRYSQEIAKDMGKEGEVVNIGVKVKDGDITVGRVTNTRNRQPNKPKDSAKNGACDSLESHIKAIVALVSTFAPEQKKDVVKMLAIELGMKASVSVNGASKA
jgi:hypothetical protein